MPVLSIQSHVVYGHAGNSAAVFPLQRLGREVWAVNTVLFSNHTGYKSWRGKPLKTSLIEDLILGLEELDVLKECRAVLSGYLGDPATGRAVISAVKKVRAHAPNALYCCDPVMGDAGRGFYVKPEIPHVFRTEIISHADIITPNHFELNILTGMTARTNKDVMEAVKLLHACGSKIILVTSLKTEEIKSCASPKIGMLVSDEKEAYLISTPELHLDSMAGSGDLTASVFLSRYLETKNIKRALELTAASVYGIMEATHKAKSRELLLIDAQEELINPSASFTAELLDEQVKNFVNS